MPDPETLRHIAEIAERFGWPVVALAALLVLAIRCGRALIRGACYVWSRVEPPILGILGSHQDLMETAKDQMPKQTAILQELSAGQREHSALLSSIHTSVRSLRADGEAERGDAESNPALPESEPHAPSTKPR